MSELYNSENWSKVVSEVAVAIHRNEKLMVMNEKYIQELKRLQDEQQFERVVNERITRLLIEGEQ